MSSTVRRKVMISSDEESDAENSTYLDNVDDPSVVPASDEEDAQEDSLAFKSLAESNRSEEEENREEIITGSESFMTAKDSSTNSSYSSFTSSTPRIKVKTRSTTYDLEQSMAKFSISRKPNNGGDRSRSFREEDEENELVSPISRKLAENNDLLSKQKLRERVLKKNALKERNSYARSPEPLLETTLSPIVATRRSLEASSHMSVDAEESLFSKNETRLIQDSDVVEDSIQESVLIASGSNSSPEEEQPDAIFYASYSESPQVVSFVDDSIQIIEDSNIQETSNNSSDIIEISDGAAEIEDEGEEDEQEPEGETLQSEDDSQENEEDEEEVVDDSMRAFITSDNSGEEDGERNSASILNNTPPQITRTRMDVNSIRRKVFISSDEEEEEKSAEDSDDEEYRQNDPSIVCLSSDDEEKAPQQAVEVPKHLQKYMEEDLHVLETKKQKMENMVKNIDKYPLPDGGAKLKATVKDLEDAIELKKKMGDGEKAEEKKDKKPQIIPPNPFDPSGYRRLLANDKKRLFGGKMTEDRFRAIHTATDKCIKGMHEALASMPDETQTLETPDGLRLELMHHQKQGLAWMTWRETQSAPGGILADDMGLGKTLSTISLVLYQKNERLKRKEEGNYQNDLKQQEIAAKLGLVPSNTTLVVAPASVIYQWEAEIEKRVNPGRLSVHVFHGPKNKRIASPKKLAKYDIVITTYNLVGTELMEKITTQNNEDDNSEEDYSNDENGKQHKKKEKAKRVLNSDSVLAQVAFERIILDEAHQIKNKNTSSSKGACAVAGRNRWCLSGTPIHNNLWDLYSLIRFLRVAPFDDESHWKEYIMKSSSKSAERLNMLTKSLLLRRTKAQTCSITQKPLIDLQPKVFKQYDIVLKGLEGDIYDMMFRTTQQHVKALMDEEDNQKYESLYGRRRKNKDDKEMKNPFNFAVKKKAGGSKFSALTSMLVMLLRLRQACVHLHLTQKAVDMEAFENLGGEAVMSAEDLLEKTLAEMTLGDRDPGSSDMVSRPATAEEVFEPTFLSSKVKKVMEIVQEVMKLDDKIVIVSQWTSLLNLIEIHLKENRTKYTTISGQVAPADRQERVDSFNKEHGGARVMLLSLTAGGVGLNLIGGNHLIMVDLHWNPALEAQACDRIYRMGQKKIVHIHRLIATGTIEQRVVALQEQKLKLANDVLDGAASKKMSKLTMQDLKYLFDLGDEKKK